MSGIFPDMDKYSDIEQGVGTETEAETAAVPSADNSGSALAEPVETKPLTPEEKKERDRRELFRALGLLSQIGVTMLVCVAIGVLFGRTMDRLLGSSPWLLVFGAFLGGASAIKMMYDISMKK